MGRWQTSHISLGSSSRPRQEDLQTPVPGMGLRFASNWNGQLFVKQSALPLQGCPVFFLQWPSGRPPPARHVLVADGQLSTSSNPATTSSLVNEEHTPTRPGRLQLLHSAFLGQ